MRDNKVTEDALHPKSENESPDEQPDFEGEIVDQDPGERQKRNQGDQKDDPLAA